MPVIHLIGASGFIGRRLSRALREAGHSVSAAADPRGADVVVNAAGIFRESRGRTFEDTHVAMPVAVFRSCAQHGVPVIHFSALGADAGATTRFHLTKKAGDEALLSMDVPSVVLQPSLVHGPGGGSARLFAALASMPAIPLPGDGSQRIQPIHIDDVCAAVLAIVEKRFYPRQRMALVGSQPTTLRAHLAALREGMNLGKPRFFRVPMPLARIAAGRDAMDMLARGNTADPAPLIRLLGRAPKKVFEGNAAEAKLTWLVPLLRLSIGLVWIASGVVSLGLYPVADSLALLARAGLTGTAAQVALYGAAILDILLGIAALAGRLWLAQIAVIVAYTAILSVAIPELWLHPFGPLTKNLPTLAVLLFLWNFKGKG